MSPRHFIEPAPGRLVRQQAGVYTIEYEQDQRLAAALDSAGRGVLLIRCGHRPKGHRLPCRRFRGQAIATKAEGVIVLRYIRRPDPLVLQLRGLTGGEQKAEEECTVTPYYLDADDLDEVPLICPGRPEHGEYTVDADTLRASIKQTRDWRKPFCLQVPQIPKGSTPLV